MNIRKATSIDVEQIRNLGNSTKEFETSNGVVLFRPKEIIQNCINKNDVLILVAEEKTEIVGFIIANLNCSLKKAELENLVVREDTRKLGIWTELMKIMLEELKELQIENVVGLTNTLVEFLQQFGFEKGNQFFRMDVTLSDSFKK